MVDYDDCYNALYNKKTGTAVSLKRIVGVRIVDITPTASTVVVGLDSGLEYEIYLGDNISCRQIAAEITLFMSEGCPGLYSDFEYGDFDFGDFDGLVYVDDLILPKKEGA